MDIDAIKGQFRDYARSNLFILQFSRIQTEKPEEDDAGGSLFDKIKSAALKVLKDFFAVPVAKTDAMVNLGVKNIVLPSVTMNAPELEWRGYKMPTLGPAVFGDFSATFIIDHDMIIYNYFLKWFNDIINIHSGQGLANIHGTEQLSDVLIYQLKSDLNIANGYLVTLEGAYPTTISQIDYGQDEAFSEFTVTFRYTNIRNENIAQEITRDEAGGKSLLDKAKGFVGGLLP